MDSLIIQAHVIELLSTAWCGDQRLTVECSVWSMIDCMRVDHPFINAKSGG